MSLPDDDNSATNETSFYYISNNRSCDKKHESCTKSDKTLSEIAFERAISVMFNQYIMDLLQLSSPQHTRKEIS